MVFRNGEPVGPIDFDYARPAPARFDIAYALQYVAPFRDDEDAIRYAARPHRVERSIRGRARSHALMSIFRRSEWS